MVVEVSCQEALLLVRFVCQSSRTPCPYIEVWGSHLTLGLPSYHGVRFVCQSSPTPCPYIEVGGSHLTLGLQGYYGSSRHHGVRCNTQLNLSTTPLSLTNGNYTPQPDQHQQHLSVCLIWNHFISDCPVANNTSQFVLIWIQRLIIGDRPPVC